MDKSDKNPSEIIQEIFDVLREREAQSVPTFFTISIEQSGEAMPLMNRENGYENFKEKITKYSLDYNPSPIIVRLYTGKSRNVKNPFKTYRIEKRKHTPAIFLGNIEKEQSNVEQVESAIPVGRYYDEKFELQLRIMRVELEKQNLTDKLLALTERYEEKLKDQEEKNKLANQAMLTEMDRLKEQIREFEQEIERAEKEKHNSFGNLALGSIGARALEGFAKSEVGMGMLKGLLGKAGFETMQGHLAGIEKEKPDAPNQSARIISDEETESKDPRSIALKFILGVGEKLQDMHLRMFYDIAVMTAKNLKDLEVLWKVAQEFHQKREGVNEEKTVGTQNQEQTETEAGQEDQTEDDNPLNIQ
jgi:hypothetical protein